MSMRSPRATIDHAKRHVVALEVAVEDFLKSEPYKIVVDTDMNPGQDTHIYRLVKPVPDLLSGIAFDAISSLRAALDQAGHAIGLAARSNGKASKFPFGDTLLEAQSRATQGSKNIPRNIFDVMLAAQPYKGGNDRLWALNKLCNTHKHEILSPMAAAAHSNTAKELSFVNFNGHFVMPIRWDSAKNEMVVVKCRPGSKFDLYLNITRFISFAKFEGVVGYRASTVLHDLANIVTGIVDAVEAEALRSGLFRP